MKGIALSAALVVFSIATQRKRGPLWSVQSWFKLWKLWCRTKLLCSDRSQLLCSHNMCTSLRAKLLCSS